MTLLPMRALRWIVLGLIALVGGCSPSCSLMTVIEPDDAGDLSFVRQVVPKLLGRKVRGSEETRLLVDVIAATPDGRGREELLDALMHDPEFAAHWQENVVDMLRVNRTGHKQQSSCYGPPLRATHDASLATFLLRQQADLDGYAGARPGEFNMSDVMASAFDADTLFPIWSAHLFPMQAKPLQGAEVSETNQRADMAETFLHVYLHRKSECMQCHNSGFSTTGPQTHWQRTWPVAGRFEQAVFSNGQGGQPEELAALFRTGVAASSGGREGVSPAAPRVPWGNLPPAGSLPGDGTATGLSAQCGSFRAAAAPTDAHAGGHTPYLTAPQPVDSSIWTVQRLLDQGRRTLARDGLVRRHPAACAACGTATCTAAPPPVLPEPATTQVQALFQAKGCMNCHGAASPAAGLRLSGAGWAAPLVDRPSQRDAMVRLVVRGDAAASMLSRKLHGSAGAGTRMPPGGTALSEPELAQVDGWINALPTTGSTPTACQACGTDACTAAPAEVEGPAALAFLLAMNLTEQVWTEVMGTPLTLAHHFPRTAAQSNVLRYLTEYTFVSSDWSLRALLRRVMLSDYFNRRAPHAQGGTTPYDEPLVHDPWTEADPRLPPLARPGWSASGPAPVPDPAYAAASQPQNHRNAMAEGVHRHSARSLTYSMHAALGWPAPKRFPDADYPSAALTQSIGQFVRDAEAGFRDTDFQGLLTWESRHKTCARPTAGPDWINRLVTAVAPFNTANPGAPVRLRDLVLTMKDWFINDPRIRVDALAQDGGGMEKDLLNQFFGVGDVDTAPADVSTPAAATALEERLREYCGVLVQSPQFWLAGLAEDGPLGTPPRLRVCNGEPCTYEAMCLRLADGMTRAGSTLQLNCAAQSVTVTERPTLRPWRDWPVLCRGGQCGFWRLPQEIDGCLRQGDPRACLPLRPPRFDLGCQRIDCGGGPLPPLDRRGQPAPALLLGWFEGATVEASQGVRLLRQAGHATDKRPPLTAGQRLAVGDLIEIPRGASLALRGPRGTFATPPRGLPLAEGQKAWVMMVTGPSVIAPAAHDDPPLRWGPSVQEEAFLRAQRERVLGMDPKAPRPPRGEFDAAQRAADRAGFRGP